MRLLGKFLLRAVYGYVHQIVSFRAVHVLRFANFLGTCISGRGRFSRLVRSQLRCCQVP